MNRIYRLVFNRALGLMQVASEVARAPRGGGAGVVGNLAGALRPVSFGVWLALGWVGWVLPAAGQQAQDGGRIVSDPNAPGGQRPTVITAPNGVPVVNITTPSRSGVSRNVYRQFDVGTEGAILNNARGDAQTQLGGWIQGNPWLATGTAKVILNEINGSDPSRLRGYLEVAGQRAEVVIANPAGILVDGAGFLNASRVTLTTGVPIVTGGALEGYRVEQGAIRVEGRGLDATQADYTDLITRSLQVNAGIWANQLQASVGANVIGADHASVEATTGRGAAPVFALDVGALGGMYANKIWLLGNEHGVGVRNAGKIGAQAGELVVTVDGRLENIGSLQSQQDTRVAAAGGIANAGTISAGRELQLRTDADLDNSGGTLNAQRVEVDASSLRNRGGAIEQTGGQQLSLHAGRVVNRDDGRIGLAASSDTPGEGQAGGSPGDGSEGGSATEGSEGGEPGTPMPVLETGAMRIAGELDNSGGRINAAGQMHLEIDAGLDNDDGQIGVRNLALLGGDMGNREGRVVVSGSASFNADDVINDGGRLEVAGALLLQARTFSNRNGSLTHSGDASTTLSVAGTLDNEGGLLRSKAETFRIESGQFNNREGRLEHAGSQGLEIEVGALQGQRGAIITTGGMALNAGLVDHRGATLSTDHFQINAGRFDNRDGAVIATGKLSSTFDVKGKFDNSADGLLASGGDLGVDATTLDNTDGRIEHAGDGTLSIHVDTLNGHRGTIAGNGTLDIRGEATDLTDGTTVAQRITIDTGNLTTAGGQLIATGSDALRLQVRGTLDNHGGTVATNGALQLEAGRVNNRAGTLQAAGSGDTRLAVTGMLDNSDGILVAAGNTVVTSAELHNAGGTMQAAGTSTLQVTVDGLLDNSADGLLASGGDLSLDATTLDNTDGRIEHAGDGMLSIRVDTLDGHRGTIAGNGTLDLRGEATDLAGGTTVARRIAIATGNLTTAGGQLIATGNDALRLQVRGALDNHDGTVATNGALQLEAGTLNNRAGTLQASGSGNTRLAVMGLLDNSAGTLVAAGNTLVRANGLRNVGGTVQAVGTSKLQVTVDGLLDNSADGLLASGGNLGVETRTLDNTDGRIEHAGNGTLSIRADTLNGHRGTIAGNGTLDIRGQTTDLAGGTTVARRIIIDTGNLTTAGGQLIATGNDALRLQVRGALDNHGGTVATNGALQLEAGTVNNRVGMVQVAGKGDTRLTVSGVFDNMGGTLAAAGDTHLTAAELHNADGIVQAAGDASLDIGVQGLLDNSAGGLIAAGKGLVLGAAVLDNREGRIEHSGEGELDIHAGTLRGVAGSMVSNGSLNLRGAQIDLHDATTVARKIAVEADDLTTAEGQLIATGNDALRLQVRDTLDNQGGTVATNGALQLDAGAVNNRAGTLQAAGSGDTRLTVSGVLDNTAGTLAAAGNTHLTAAELRNVGGTVQAAGTSTLQVTVDGLLDNSADGLLASGGDLGLNARTLGNTDGRIEHAGDGALSIRADTLNGRRGTIASNGALDLRGETTDLTNGTTVAQRIAVATGNLTTAGGQLIAAGTDDLRLQVRGTLDNHGGTVATNGALQLDAGAVNNRAGTLQAAGSGDTRLSVSGVLDNTAGTLAAAGNTHLTAAELRNVGGTVQAAGTSTLQVTVDGLLDNSADGLLASGGDLSLDVTTLDNTEGRIEHAGDGMLSIQAGTLNGYRGTIASNGALDLRGETTDLTNGTAVAQRIAVTTGNLTTAGGQLIAAGTDDLRVQVRNALDNADGIIATNGALQLDAGTVNNRAGTLQAAGSGDTRLSVSGVLDNTAGTVAAAGNTHLTAAELRNVGGTVQAAGTSTLQVTVDGLLDNSADGLLASGGDLSLEAATLDNTEGRIEHAGDGALSIRADTLNGRRGTIASNGALDLRGETTDLTNGTTVAQRIAVTTGNLTTAGGQLIAAGTDDLRVQVRNALDNADGIIATNGTLQLDAGTVNNRAGTLQAAGSGDTRLSVSGVLDNTAGTVAAAGNTHLTAAELRNVGGAVQAAGTSTLQVTVDGLLDNSADGLLASGGDLSLDVTTLDNTEGRIEHAGDGALSIRADTLNGRRGTIASNGALDLRGETTDLTNGTTVAQRIAVTTGNLTTAGGQLIAAGTDDLRVQVRNALDNADGIIATNGALQLDAGTVNNRAGMLQAAGSSNTRLTVSGVLDNTAGTLAAAGNTHLTAAELRNVGGTVQAAGTSTLQVTVDGLLDNSADGLLASGGDLGLNARTLGNTDGRIEHAGDGALSIRADTLNGRRGTIASNGALDLRGETTDLTNGTTVAQRIAVTTGNLTTAGGQLIAAGTDDLRLQVRGTLDNHGGTVATNGALQLDAGTVNNRAGTLQAAGRGNTRVAVTGVFDNRQGELASAGAMAVNAADLDNSNGRLLSTTQAGMRLNVRGALANRSGSITGNGDVTVQAASLDNQAGVIETQRSIDTSIGGLLDNSGGSLLAGAGLSVDAGTLVNGASGLVSGAHVVLRADLLDNRGGRMGAAQGLEVTGQRLLNVDGTLDGSGMVSVVVAELDNTRGRLVQRGGAGGLALDVTSAIGNAHGLIGAEGEAHLMAAGLSNREGVITAQRGLGITVTGVMDNGNGLLQSDAGIVLAGGGMLDNADGRIDAAGALSVSAASIANRGGSMLAGKTGATDAGLSLDVTGALDNRLGQIGSRGGDVSVQAASLDNSGGTLVAQRNINLHTGVVNNNGGTLYAGGDLRYQNAAGRLDNGDGRFGAGGTAWLELAQIANGAGGRIQAGTLWLETPAIGNHGDIVADALHVTLNGLSGNGGRLYAAQWLDARYDGDFTYTSQELASDGRLDLRISGRFTNQGTLKSAGELNVIATDVVNQGAILASNGAGTGVATITASGTLDNRRGASIEADHLYLSANSVINTGDITGNVVQVDASTLTNGRDLGQMLASRDYGEGFIGAAGYMELRIAQQLSNLDGEIFSGGDLVITGRAAGSRVQRVDNNSGRIQADGGLWLDADSVLNQRRVLQTEQRQYVGQEQFDDPDGGTLSGGDIPAELRKQYCDDGLRTTCTYFQGYVINENRVLEGTRLVAASAAGQLLSGGGMRLNLGRLDNLYSTISAGGSLTINGRAAGDGSDPSQWGGVINNVALAGYKIIQRESFAELNYQTCARGMTCEFEPRYEYINLGSSTVRKDYVLAEGAASITAGGGLSIVGGAINNTVVQASGGTGGIAAGPLGNTGGTGLGSAVQGQAGTAGAVGTAAGQSASIGGPVQAAQGHGVQAGQDAGTYTHARVDGRDGVSTHQTDSIDGMAGPAASAADRVLAGSGVDTVDGGQAQSGQGPAAVDGSVRPGVIASVHGVAGGGVQGSAGPDGAAPQLVGTAEAPLPGLVPADNGMFRRNADPDSPFLVTTAPRFVPGEVVGSEHLLGQLSRGDADHKRLGDAYYEQRLVQEQLLQLTGRNSPQGGLEQYRTLMDNAAQVADALGLKLGAPLTSAQIGALDRDIVWLVEQEIDGQKVLVPVVYLSRATAEQLRAGGALIAGESVGIQSSATLSNNGTLSASQGMWLGADTLINDGALNAGAQLSIATAGDTVNRGSIEAGSVAINAGRDFVQTASGSLAGAEGVAVVAGRDLSLQQTTVASGGNLLLGAGNDLHIDASQVQAGGDLVVSAGRNLDVTALTTQQTMGGGRNVSTHETLQNSSLQAGGNLALQAGQDLTLQAADVRAGDAMALVAGRDLNLTTVTTVDTSLIEVKGKRYSKQTESRDETVHGTVLQAGGDIALVAGRDATLTAAGVYGEDGGIALSAGRDVNLLAAQEQHDLTIDEQRKKKGLFSSKTTTTHDEWHESLAVGTTLSGESVQIAAGRDLTAQGTQIAGTGDVLLAAGRDLTLTTAENTYSESHDKTVKKSGLFSGGGIGFTIGKQQTDTESDITGVTHAGSTVGSLEGDVTLVAGNKLSITGSDVLALEGDIIGKAKSIEIAEVHDTSTAEQQTRFKQSGLTVAVSAPVLSVLQTADDLNKASKQSGGDGRMQALAAGAAALNAYNSAGALSELGQGLASGNATDMAKGANLSISATIGGSKSESQSTQSSSTAKGSTLQAGGDVTLIATGGGQDSNIVVRGSDISAGNDLLLLADNAITLESAQDTAGQHSSSKSSSAAIGVAATIGSGGTSFGVTASASAARGNADGEDLIQRNTHVSAGNTATVISGGDTTLKGAQLSAERVLADIGGDLNIESLQDTSTYDSKNKSMGGSVTVGAGFSGSASYSSSKVSGDYASVTEQSGIFAGGGGFDIRVEGNTDLKGALIASTQEAVDAGVNRLQTGTITASDIENHSDYSAKGVSLSGGYSAGGKKDGDTGAPSTTDKGSDWSWQNFNTGAQGAAAGYGSKSGSDGSTTISGISGGVVVITDVEGQQARTGQSAEEILAGLNREVLSTDDVNGLIRTWDGEKLQQQVEAQAQITAMFGQQASKAVGDYASRKALELRLQGNEEEAAKWDEGGAYRVAAHAVMGALGGGLEGALGSGSAAAAAPYLTELTSQLPDGVKEAIGAGLAAGLGAALGGGAGASMAFNEDANNRMLHPEAVKWIREHASEFAEQQGISEQEAYRILLVEGAAYVDQGVQDKLAQLGSYDNEAAIEFLMKNQDVYGNLAAFDGDHRNISMFDNELGRSTQEFIDVFNALAATVGTKGDWHMTLAPANNAFADASASQWGVAKLQAASAGVGVLAAAGVVFYPMLPEWAAAGTKGAGISSSIYVGTVAGKATSETWKGGSFLEAYGDNFSWARFGISATTGAVGGMYTQQMLMWSGVPVGFFPSIKTAGGLVIRVNSMLKSAAVSKAANAVVDQHEKNVSEGGK